MIPSGLLGLEGIHTQRLCSTLSHIYIIYRSGQLSPPIHLLIGGRLPSSECYKIHLSANYGPLCSQDPGTSDQ
jgi:hypothetical protein